MRSPQRITVEPQVTPPPNAVCTTTDPGSMRPCSSASASAMGIEAAAELPWVSMLTITFFGGSPRRRAAASMIRALA